MSESDESEYRRAHQSVKEIHGPASLHDCAFCSTDARDWAYNHRDPNAKIAQFNGCAYSTDPTFYLPLCRSCHKQFDNKHRRKNVPARRSRTRLTVKERGRIEKISAPRPGFDYRDLSLFVIRSLSRAFELGTVSNELDDKLDQAILRVRQRLK